MSEEQEDPGIPEARLSIDEVIRENITVLSQRFGDKPDGIAENEIVLGWFLVVETMAGAELNGHKTEAFALHTLSANTTADRELTPWTAKGLLHQVLDDAETYLLDYDHFSDKEGEDG